MTNPDSTTHSNDRVDGDPHPQFDHLVGSELAGRYRLLGKLGEGGFGIVYEAEQLKPIRRRVAIKVLKPGMDSRAVLARFEAERQAMAVMDHPCIAKVFDAGETDRGLPFFVMELVKGVPITDHCDRRKLTIKERLELFSKVCEAIQHAHTKAIIHRDIKPSNILIQETSRSDTLPKIIDFGIAKALSHPLVDFTIFTERGQAIGTPEYMSPEQAGVGGPDIDTRSDIYSLGVLLYELIAGVRPFDLKKAALLEVQRIIRDQDPPRPSTRLTEMGDTARELAQQRRLDPRSLSGTLKRELEWIPLKALRKDREQRYRTASDLAEDIMRYLRGEALEAGPEAASYRVRKFVRANKGLALAVSATFCMLAAGLIVSTIVTSIVSEEKSVTQRALESERSAVALANKRAQELEDALADIQDFQQMEQNRVRESAGLIPLNQDPKSVQLLSDSRVDLDWPPLGKAELVTVHHSGTPFTSMEVPEVFEHIRMIRGSHMGRGWRDIGYHFVIDPAGRVWTGRSLLEQGAHVASQNGQNIGIVVLGDFNRHDITPKAAESLVAVLDQLVEAFGLDAGGIVTHREIAITSDPGPPLQSIIDSYRRTRGSTGFSEPVQRRFGSGIPIDEFVPAIISHAYVFNGRDGRRFWSVRGEEISPASPVAGHIIVDLYDEKHESIDQMRLAFAATSAGSRMTMGEQGKAENELVGWFRDILTTTSDSYGKRPWIGRLDVRGFARLLSLNDADQKTGMEPTIKSARVRVSPDPTLRRSLVDLGVEELRHQGDFTAVEFFVEVAVVNRENQD